MSTIEQQHRLGRAIAELYIAAQEGVSQEASDAACELIDGASPFALTPADGSLSCPFSIATHKR